MFEHWLAPGYAFATAEGFNAQLVATLVDRAYIDAKLCSDGGVAAEQRFLHGKRHLQGQFQQSNNVRLLELTPLPLCFEYLVQEFSLQSDLAKLAKSPVQM